ncbi:hypothetical protein [Hymenobacter sp. BT188]|uniref:hypothetical protein n=1 Tax=Hymenobacter sp. BT188 TaxID=2763504 RepID=UPI00165113D4|nr:hypothetical protein [Hymenobacter sp. BT188]
MQQLQISLAKKPALRSNMASFSGLVAVDNGRKLFRNLFRHLQHLYATAPL